MWVRDFSLVFGYVSNMCSTVNDGVDAMAAVPVATLTIEQLQALVVGASSASARLQGVASRALAELLVRGSGQVPDGAGTVCPTPAWLRTATQTSGSAAGRQIRTGVALRELPAVAQAVVDDDVTMDHGRVLARLVGTIEPSALLSSQPALIEVARRTDPEQLAHYVRHLIATWCEPQLTADEAAAEDRRFLQVVNTHRGSWRGRFELPDAAMEIVLTALEPLARRDGLEDARSAGQRRADALLDVLGSALRHGDLPAAGGSRPVLTDVVPAAWAAAATEIRRLCSDPLALPSGGSLLALDRHPGEHCASGPWTGPATRSQIEALLCDSRVQRVVLDDEGQVVSLTSVTGQITSAQRRTVAVRDRCCTAKGCSRPPAFCDVHHLWAVTDGGPTEIDNLVLLCRRHHVMWHRQLLDLSDLRVPWKRVQQPRAPSG